MIGDHILVDMYGDAATDLVCGAAIRTQTETITMKGLEPRVYTVVGTLHESIRSTDGTTRTLATLGVVGGITLGAQGFHVVDVAANQVVTGVDLGNRREASSGSLFGVSNLKRNSEISGVDFGDVPVPVTEIKAQLVIGDVDFDHDVDFTDFLRLAANFGQPTDAAFADGDFDLSGLVDFADFLALAANFGGTR